MTPRQEAFVREYMIDLNGTQAAIRAGYSARTANEQAARLLADVSVRSAVEKAKAERAARTGIDADWVLRRLRDEAEADLADMYDDAGNLLPVREWPKIWRTGLVVGVETESERDGNDADGKPQYVTVRKVKLSERIRRIELIGKHVDVEAFRERMDVTGTLTLTELLREVEARRAKRGA